MSFADRLDHLMKTANGGQGITAEALAKGVGRDLSAVYIRRLRTGEAPNPTLKTLKTLADFFGVDPSHFVTESDVASVAERVGLAQMLQDPTVREIALRASALDIGGRKALLDMADHIHKLQSGVSDSGSAMRPMALIVEDDRDSAEIAQLRLQGVGFDTEVIRTGVDAIERLAGPVADVVVLDLYLPERPGTTVLEALRHDTRWAKVPVVVATAHWGMAEEVRELANEIFVKPFDYESLAQYAKGLLASPGG